MINTILFDLDGTLLKLDQETFVNAYFGRIRKVFVKLGIDPDTAIKGIWVGTKAMVVNDGTVFNKARFWDAFTQFLNLDDEQRLAAECYCDEFYSGDFDAVREIIEPTDVPKRLIPALKAKGYTIVLATNPLFPECAVATRLNWIGLDPNDFKLITHYANSKFCKPNVEYFGEILEKIGKSPQECIMVGNNVVEDLNAALVGIDTYLVTDYLENDTDIDIEAFKHGSLDDAERYLMTL